MTFYQRLLTNHPLVNILFLVVVGMGIISYSMMPREQDPEISFNWLQVTTLLPGASAEDVEELVTSPLEDAIRGVQNLKFVSSQSSEGLSNILIRLQDLDERIADKRFADLRREIQAKFNDELPEDTEDPEITELDTSSGFPTALIVVAGQADDEVLRQNARRIQLAMERLPGVDRVTALGMHAPELLVSFDPVALANRGLTAIDIATPLQRGYKDISAGTVDVDAGSWLIRVDESDPAPEVLAALEIDIPGSNAVVRLGDVATIQRARKDPSQLIRFNGRPAVSLAVTKVAYTNTIELIGDIEAYVASSNEIVQPLGLSVVLADDQTLQTRKALGIMETNSALGLTLVLLVCWAFLGIRIAAMVTLGIVFSITGAFVVLNVTGNTLNVSVLLGIVIVLGMLVDDAVVVVEAMYYRLQRGSAPYAAALGAMREVGAPVTAAVLTTISAFLPLMLLPGIVGKFMFVIPFVVTVGLLVSLVEAFWILPAHVIGQSNAKSQRKMLERDFRTRVTHKVRLRYARMLTRVMRHPLISGLVGLAVMAAAIVLVASGAIKNEFFTFDPVRIFYVHLQMPPDARIEDTLAAAEDVEQVVKATLTDKETRAVTVQAGTKFTETELLIGDQWAQLQVSLNEKQPDDRSVAQIVQELRPQMAALASPAQIAFLEISGGPPRTPPVQVKVRGDNFDVISEAARNVADIVAEIPGIKDIQINEVPGRRQLIVALNEALILEQGLVPSDIARLLRLHTDGEIVSTLRADGEKVELRVRAEQQSFQRIDAVLDTPVALPRGGATSLRALVTYSVERGRGVIQHFNFRRALQVTAELESDSVDTVAANAMIVQRWASFAAEYPEIDLEFSGALDDIQESLDALGPLMLFGIGLIYLVLATQFKSYWQPLLILLTVPMALTGVVFGLTLTGNPLSLYTMYGAVALIGIAVNSAIVLIDAGNARIKAGMRPLHATVYAARRRVIPILMTTSTTIAGLFSLAAGLGGKSLLWGPVATSIVSGLLVATVLTLFVIPMIYRLTMKLSVGVAERKAARLATEH
ncbi:MAG: efflux RND transporter permease subunit [Pseudomonadota bacterium]